jgi:hypothetical protein
VAIRNGTRTDVFLTGDPAHAGFVQVVHGRVSNFNDAREHLRGLQDALKDHLPALLGTVTVEHGAGWFTRGSTTPRLVLGTPTFLDVREPWVHRAAHPDA